MNDASLPPVRKHMGESPAVAPAKRRRWMWIVALIVTPMMLCGGLGMTGLIWLAYETGNHESSNNIRITSAARDAFLKA